MIAVLAGQGWDNGRGKVGEFLYWRLVGGGEDGLLAVGRAAATDSLDDGGGFTGRRQGRRAAAATAASVETGGPDGGPVQIGEAAASGGEWLAALGGGEQAAAAVSVIIRRRQRVERATCANRGNWRVCSRSYRHLHHVVCALVQGDSFDLAAAGRYGSFSKFERALILSGTLAALRGECWRPGPAADRWRAEQAQAQAAAARAAVDVEVETHNQAAARAAFDRRWSKLSTAALAARGRLATFKVRAAYVAFWRSREVRPLWC
ncbi:MAG: hypothetical protein ACYDC1_01880 [Limisphaerales bacterium]